MIQEKNLLLRTLEKSLSSRIQRGPYHWGFLKSAYHWETKRRLNHWRPSGAWTPSITFVLHKTPFGILVMVYDSMVHGGKFSYKDFGIGRPCFQVTSHLKTEAKESFS